jgi:ADP-ribose pyrophosphatase YjhB (NUDIX family)
MAATSRPADCQVHKLAADVAILAEHSVVLARYRDVRSYDGQRGWFLPDDHLDRGEHPLDAARRIARDQLGMDLGSLRLAFVESFGGEKTAWHLVFHCVATPTACLPITAGENVAARSGSP